MNYQINTVLIIIVTALSSLNCNSVAVMNKETKKIPLIQIVLGSTRKGRSSDKIGNLLKQMADKRGDISTQIVDLRDFTLPFLNDEEAPSRRKQITDPLVKKWSDKIKEADSFIIIVPEYNAGYPGVLKNALDSLYVEWNNKPVAFVGYSGGPSGGKSVINQLREVTVELEMIPVSLEIKIPTFWKAFDQQGNLVDKTIEARLNSIIDQLIGKKADQPTEATQSIK